MGCIAIGKKKIKCTTVFGNEHFMIKRLLISLFIGIQSLSAQNIEQATSELLHHFVRMEIFGATNETDSMSLHSDQFKIKLSNLLSTDKSSITYHFKSLKALGLVVADSPDSAFRIYSWRENPADSNTAYISMFQWLQYDTIRAELKTIFTENQSGCYFKIYTITDELNTFYLANYWIDNHYNQPSYQAIHVMDFERNYLNTSFKKIKTKNGLTHRLAFHYDPASISETFWKETEMIRYDTEMQAIILPIVQDHGQIRNQTIVYIYDGDYFIKQNN